MHAAGSTNPPRHAHVLTSVCRWSHIPQGCPYLPLVNVTLCKTSFANSGFSQEPCDGGALFGPHVCAITNVLIREGGVKTGAEVGVTSFESRRWATNPGKQVPQKRGGNWFSQGPPEGSSPMHTCALHGETSGLWSRKLTPLWHADCLVEALGCQRNTIHLLLWVGTIG